MKFILGGVVASGICISLSSHPCHAKWNVRDASGTRIDSLHLDQDSPGSTLIYAGTNAGIYKSTDLGDNWQYIGVKFRDISAITHNSGCDNYLTAAGFGSVFQSSDGGDNWSLAVNGCNTKK